MPCIIGLNWPRWRPLERSISATRCSTSPSLVFRPSFLASWICSFSSIIWRSIWAAMRWRSSGLSCRPVVRMANSTRCERSKSVMASSFTRATTRRPWAEHEGGQQTEEDRQDGAKERRGH